MSNNNILLIGAAKSGTTELDALALVREGKVEAIEHTLYRDGAEWIDNFLELLIAMIGEGYGQEHIKT